MTKGTKLYSILRNKCPRCQEGKFFDSSNQYNLPKMTSMPDRCPVCNQNYIPETGFYYGAMYVSYGLGVAIFVAVWVISSFLIEDLNAFVLIALIIGSLLLLFPVTFRTARLVWINLFVKYQKGITDNVEQKQK